MNLFIGLLLFWVLLVFVLFVLESDSCELV